MTAPLQVKCKSVPHLQENGYTLVELANNETDPVTGLSWPREGELWTHLKSGKAFELVHKDGATLHFLKTDTEQPSINPGDAFQYSGFADGRDKNWPKPKQ